MKIATPIATMGIRGTTGVVDVPQAGTAGEPKIKLYPDADGHVGRIEVFDRQGARLGTLTQGSSAFALRGPDLAAASRQSRSRFRRRKRYATAACCSGSLPRTQSVSVRRPSAGNYASATGNGPNELRRQGGPREQQNIRGNPGGRPTREPGTPGPLRAAPRKSSPSGQKRK